MLAFVFGYSLTAVPLLRSGLALRPAAGIALASDTVSIAVMEIVDNAIVLLIPGAMEAGLDDAALLGQPRVRARSSRSSRRSPSTAG